VFFCNSGTEAVESALKFARYATGRRRVIYCDHAFHGLTTGSLSINGSAEFRRGFDPLLPDTSIPLGDLDALAAELRKGDVAALIIEPIQGKGVHMPPDGFLTAAAKLLHEHGALLICDEVQSGFGRTGTFFAYQHEEVTPDIVTVGQGAVRRVRAGRRDAGHGAGVREGLFLDGPGHGAQRHVQGRRAGHDGRAGRAASPGRRGAGRERRTDRCRAADGADHDGRTVRRSRRRQGPGLMIGLEFDKPSSLRARTSWNMLQKARVGLFAQMVVVALFQRHRILTQVSGDHMEVIKLIPPLMIGDTEVKLFTEAFGEVLEDASKGSGLIWEFGRTLVSRPSRASR